MNKGYYISLQGKIDDSAASISKLNNQIKQLENKISSLEIKIKTPSSTSKGFGDLNTQLDKLKINMKDFEGNVLSANSTFNTTTTRYTNNAGKILTVTEKMVNGQSKYKVSLKEVNKAIENNAKQANSWGYNWDRAWKGFLAYQSVTEIFYHVKHAIGDMINEVIELDSALIELQKVTDLEGASLDSFVKRAYEAGETVAKTGTEMVQAATEFAKAGYKDEALELGTIASMYTNIADEEVSAADAAEMLISQMKAFNIEASNAEHIIDAVNEVSNNFAVSSADIANNLGKSSAVMANAGNSMEQMIGLLTAGTEVTRSASKVANGLKTITLRLQGMTDEGEEDLELMSKMESMFNKLGKTVYDSNGSLKSTYDLLGELAEVYPTLTAAEKAYVTETIAGKFQAQNAAAILNNWSTAVEATATALDSQGSAARENDKVLDSIKGHMAALNSAWEEFARNVISSNLIKIFIDLGTVLINIANTGIGGFIIKSSALILALVSLKTAFAAFAKSTLALNFSNLINGVKDYMKYQILLYAQTKKQTIATYEEAAANIGLAGSIKAVTLAMLSNPIFLGLAAVTAIIAFSNGIGEASNKMEELEEKVQDATEAYNESQSKVDKLNSSLSEINSKIQELESKGFLTFIEQKELDNLKETSAELEKQVKYNEILAEQDAKKKNVAVIEKYEADFGDESEITRFYNNNNNFANWLAGTGIPIIADWGNEWSTAVKHMSETDLLNQTIDEYKEAVSSVEEYQKEVLDLQDKIVKAKNEGKDTKDLEFDLDISQDLLERYSGRIEDYKNELSDYAARIKEYADGITYIEEATSEEDKKSNELKDSLNEQYNSIIRLINPTEALAADMEYVSKKYKDGYKEIKDAIKNNELNEESLDKLKEKYSELWGYLSEHGWKDLDILSFFSGEEIYDEIDAFETLNKTIDSIQKAYDSLNSAIDEYNEQGYFSVDTLQALNSLGWEYLQYLFDENGQLNLNETAMRNLAIAQLEKMKATALDEALDYAQKLAEEKGAITEEETKVDDLKQAIMEMNEEKAKSIALDLLGGDEKALAEFNKRLPQTMAYIHQIQNTIDKVSSGSGRITSSSSKSSSSKSQKEWWEEQLDALKDQFKYNEITINEYINSLTNLLGQVGRGTDAWRKINEELQKQRLTKVEDDYKRGITNVKQYVAQLKELIKAYREGSEAWLDLADKIKKGLQEIAKTQKSDLETAANAAMDIIDKEIDRIDDLRSAEEERYNKLIEEKEKANDETEREIELARLQEALENARSQKVKRVWREGIGKKSADVKDNYIGQMLEIVKTEVRLNLRGCVYG